MSKRINFSCDYLKGGHERVLNRLVETNMVASDTYGFDEFSASAKEKIREACGCSDAEVLFLPGGTQTNATMLDALLSRCEGVICPDTGHINVHESGAIEAYGHKVLALPNYCGKLTATQVDEYMTTFENDPTNDHMVQPRVVYISQSTELGSVYKLQELEQLSNVCKKHNLLLYLDGARLCYALGSSENDADLKDIARLCDAFYIGGTKCGALFGESAVIPDPELVKNLFVITKQHGAVMAKGRIIGIQFDELFKDGLYLELGKHATECAELVREAVEDSKFSLAYDSPTNQIFIESDNERLEKLSESIIFDFWESTVKDRSIIRVCTSWYTSQEELNFLCEVLRGS